MRVLMVDDDALLRETIALGLAASGHEAYPVSSCDEAAAVARSWKPDVVVCDLFHAGDAGLVADLGAPVLLASGASDDYLAAAARRLGAAGTLRKPYAWAELLAALRALEPAAGDGGAHQGGRGATGRPRPGNRTGRGAGRASPGMSNAS